MNKTEVVDLLKFISGAYGKFTINENTPMVWHEFLKDADSSDVMQRLKRHILESRFDPTINDLLPSKDEKEKKIRDREIARNRWISEGNDPNEFRYNSPTGA